MSAVNVYNLEGEIVSKVELNPKVFDVQVNVDLVHQSLVAQSANSRQTVAHTKTRGEVRGGGKKPWRQKGTGRARHGSIRSPLWKGGSVTFGPTKERNFSKAINKKMKKKALLMGLSDRVGDQALFLLKELKIEEVKTKRMVDIFKKLDLSDKKILLVVPESNEKVWLSIRNIPGVNLILADSLNIYDVLNNDRIVMPVESVNIIEKTYLK